MSAGGTRSAFTLSELLVGMVLTAIVSLSLMRMIMSDQRFAEDREAWRQARQAARMGVTVVSSDVRMVDPGGGIESAAADGRDLTLRVPYAFGVLCGTNGGSTVVAFLPTDSLVYAQPGFSGFAWRDTTSGKWTYVTSGTTLTESGTASTCTGAGITVITGARLATLGGAVPATLPPGTLLFAYRRVRYEIRSSAAMPGQVGLWRTLVTSGDSEELAAPFEGSARFKYYTPTGIASQTAVPAPLSSMTGLELAFATRSQSAPRGSAGRKTMPFSTSIFFKNR